MFSMVVCFRCSKNRLQMRNTYYLNKKESFLIRLEYKCVIRKWNHCKKSESVINKYFLLFPPCLRFNQQRYFDEREEFYKGLCKCYFKVPVSITFGLWISYHMAWAWKKLLNQANPGSSKFIQRFENNSVFFYTLCSFIYIIVCVYSRTSSKEHLGIAIPCVLRPNL